MESWCLNEAAPVELIDAAMRPIHIAPQPAQLDADAAPGDKTCNHGRNECEQPGFHYLDNFKYMRSPMMNDMHAPERSSSTASTASSISENTAATVEIRIKAIAK